MYLLSCVSLQNRTIEGPHLYGMEAMAWTRWSTFSLANTEYSVSSCKWFVKGHDPSLIRRSEIQLLLTQNSWADTFLVMNRRYSTRLSSLFFCRSKISCWPDCQKMPQSQWFVKTFFRLLDLSQKRPSNSILFCVLHRATIPLYTIIMVTRKSVATVVWFTKKIFFSKSLAMCTKSPIIFQLRLCVYIQLQCTSILLV